MANLLSTAISVNNAVSAAENINVSGDDWTNVGISSALSAATAITAGQNPLQAAANAAIGQIPGASSIASAANSVFDTLGIDGPLAGLVGSIGGINGTKPGALHTEFATGSANWTKPYGAGTDITFYLMRAGGGEEATGEAAVLGDDPFGAVGLSENPLNSAIDGAVPADIAAGVGLPDGMSSALNQVASAATIAGSVAGVAGVPSLVGPMTGLNEALTMSPDLFTSATAVLTNPTSANIASALGATAVVTDTFGVTSGLSNTIDSSMAASEAFFNETLDNSFNTGGVVEGLAKVPTSEFSTILASTTGGITSTTDFIAGMNSGSLGFTSTSSAAEAERTGPQGTPQKKS